MKGSIFIAVPAFGQTASTHTVSSLMALAKVLLANGYDYYFSEYSFPDIAESRNLLTTIWWDKTEAEWMLQVDADMSFDPEMVMAMLAFGKPLTGCLYPKKTYPIEFVGRGITGLTPKVDGGFLEVEGVGFGVTLVHRSCLQDMLDSGHATSDDRLKTHVAGPMLGRYGITRIIRAFDPIETESGKLTEDLSFCRRHRNSGGEVWAATHYGVTHVGQHGYSGRYADSMAKAAE